MSLPGAPPSIENYVVNGSDALAAEFPYMVCHSFVIPWLFSRKITLPGLGTKLSRRFLCRNSEIIHTSFVSQNVWSKLKLFCGKCESFPSHQCGYHFGANWTNCHNSRVLLRLTDKTLSPRKDMGIVVISDVSVYYFKEVSNEVLQEVHLGTLRKT